MSYSLMLIEEEARRIIQLLSLGQVLSSQGLIISYQP
jgi:hypothetical protein